MTDAMYRSSAQLSAYLAIKYLIPIDRKHFIGHNEVPDPTIPAIRRVRAPPPIQVAAGTGPST
jgi:hypothetical protein